MSFQQTTSQFGSPSGSAGLLRGGPLVAGVEVSVLLSESHNLSSTATKTALENGAVVSDHVILSPAEVTIGFAMTNAGNGADQARDVYSTFKRLRDAREVMELITEHAIYKDMVVIGVDMIHQAPFKGALNVTVTLQQLHFVEIQSVGRDPKVLRGVTEKTASKQVDGGTVKAEERRSLFARGQDAATSR